jgi:hypothetical protein
MKPTPSPTARLTAPLLAIALLALAIAPVAADRRDVRNTTRTDIHQNTNVNRNTNVNVNRNTHVDIDVDTHHGGYYGRGPSVAGVVAASVATAIVVGAVVNSLPPNCSTLVVNGFAYQQCGGYYYQPRYSGSSVTYVVVNHP